MTVSLKATTTRTRSLRLLVLALVLAPLPLVGSTCFRVPVTASAPRGLYLLTYRPPARDEWVVACLPARQGRFGRRRGYLAGGRCPGGASEVLKRVAALPGDLVTVAPCGLAVDGRLLPGTARRRHDSAGRPVPSIPSGTYRVAAGSVWLYSAHSPASWDSRYYGPVPLADVRSDARLLFSTLFDANPLR